MKKNQLVASILATRINLRITRLAGGCGKHVSDVQLQYVASWGVLEKQQHGKILKQRIENRRRGKRRVKSQWIFTFKMFKFAIFTIIEMNANSSKLHNIQRACNFSKLLRIWGRDAPCDVVTTRVRPNRLFDSGAPNTSTAKKFSFTNGHHCERARRTVPCQIECLWPQRSQKPQRNPVGYGTLQKIITITI